MTVPPEASSTAFAQGSRSIVKVAPEVDLKIFDPVWTTALITRNHGYMVYDTLFAVDDKLQVRPQMVDKHEVSADKLTWTFTLRDGLEWSNGTPVTAEDCIASIRRWAARDAMGQKLMDFTRDMAVVDGHIMLTRFWSDDPKDDGLYELNPNTGALTQRAAIAGASLIIDSVAP